MITTITPTNGVLGEIMWEAHDASGKLIDVYETDTASDADRKRAWEYFQKVYGVAN